MTHSITHSLALSQEICRKRTPRHVPRLRTRLVIDLLYMHIIQKRGGSSARESSPRLILVLERWAHLQPRVEQKTEQDALFQIYPTGRPRPSSTIDSELRPVHSHNSQRGFD